MAKTTIEVTEETKDRLIEIKLKEKKKVGHYVTFNDMINTLIDQYEDQNSTEKLQPENLVP